MVVALLLGSTLARAGAPDSGEHPGYVSVGTSWPVFLANGDLLEAGASVRAEVGRKLGPVTVGALWTGTTINVPYWQGQVDTWQESGVWIPGDGTVHRLGATIGAMSEPEGFVWAVRGGAGVTTWTCRAGREAYDDEMVPAFGTPSTFGLSSVGAWSEAVSEVGFQLGPGAVVVTNTSGVLLLGGEVVPVTELGWGFRAAF